MQPSDNDWPFAVAAIKSEPTVDISQLDTQQKHQLWLGIKQLNPSLAEMLGADPVIAKLKATFQASINLTKDDVEKYLKAGQKQ